MRKLFVFPLAFMALGLGFCTSSKQPSTSSEPAKKPTVTYLANIQPLVNNNCGPCHFPPKGNKKPLDTYADVKSEIDDIITRIQLNPDERGFMPARHPKLSDSDIQAFKTWKAEGLAEK